MAALAVAAIPPGTAGAQQPQPAPALQPPPIETPIGTEASTLDESPLPARKIVLPASISLKLATWNFAARKPGETAPKSTPRPAAPQKAWRHTFGSERTTANWRMLSKRSITANIIALQGIRSLRDVRQLYNARQYHIVSSRQLLARSTPTSSGLAVFRDDAPPTTAVAFQRRRGVRVAGYRHFLPPRVKSPAAEPAAITAFRLRIYGKLLWIASLDAPPGCETADGAQPADMAPACSPHNDVLMRFVAFAGETAKLKTPLIILGQWPKSLAASLKNAGLEVHQQADTGVRCTPPPAAILVASVGSPETATLLDPQPAKSNQCAGTADLQFKLK